MEKRSFDMDGTFVGELYPSYYEYNLLEYRVLDDFKTIYGEQVKVVPFTFED